MKKKSPHIKTMCNFNIHVPTANVEIIEKYAVAITDGQIKTRWCKHENTKGIKKEYDQLLENFEREVCDVFFVSPPDKIFLLAATELNPGYKTSNRWRYIGIVEVCEDAFQVVWLHPYFRQMNIMSTFMLEYAKCEGILGVQPPVSKNMQKCMKTVQQNLLKDEMRIKIYQIHIRNYFVKRGANIDEVNLLNRNSLFKAMDSLTYLTSALHRDKIKNVDGSKFADMAVKMQLLLQNNPEMIEELKNDEKFKELTKNSVNDVEEIWNDFLNYGNYEKRRK